MKHFFWIYALVLCMIQCTKDTDLCPPRESDTGNGCDCIEGAERKWGHCLLRSNMVDYYGARFVASEEPCFSLHETQIHLNSNIQWALENASSPPDLPIPSGLFHKAHAGEATGDYFVFLSRNYKVYHLDSAVHFGVFCEFQLFDSPFYTPPAGLNSEENSSGNCAFLGTFNEAMDSISFKIEISDDALNIIDSCQMTYVKF